jgi:hypothetical protein
MPEPNNKALDATRELLTKLASGDATENRALLDRAFAGRQPDPRPYLEIKGTRSALATHWLGVLSTFACLDGRGPLTLLLETGFADQRLPDVSYPGGYDAIVREWDRPCASTLPIPPGREDDRVAAIKRKLLEERLEQLVSSYGDLLVKSAIDGDENAARRAGELEQRIQDLEAMIRALDQPKQRSHRLESQLHKMDFLNLVRLVRRFIEAETSRFQAGLLLLQRCVPMSGRLAVRRVREVLSQSTGSGRFRAVQVSFRVGDRHDPASLLRCLARELAVDIDGFDPTEQIDRIADTICGSLQGGSILLLEIGQCDYLASYHPGGLQWLVVEFWQRFLSRLQESASRLPGRVIVLGLVLIDAELPDGCLPTEHCCTHDVFAQERLMEVELEPWTISDIENWLTSFAAESRACPQEHISAMAEAIHRASAGGLPSLIANQILEACEAR